MAKEYEVRWSPVAIQDLDEILVYLSTRDSPEAAALIYARIRERADTLAFHPLRCRVVPELAAVGVTEYRELIASPYRVFYRIRGDVVEIADVLDGRRDLEEVLIARVLSRE